MPAQVRAAIPWDRRASRPLGARSGRVVAVIAALIPRRLDPGSRATVATKIPDRPAHGRGALRAGPARAPPGEDCAMSRRPSFTDRRRQLVRRAAALEAI